jgi:C-terminal processing protease CtpA/Prc
LANAVAKFQFQLLTAPISKTNWEGTGVEPDVPVKAADALEKAEELAKNKLPQQ